MPVSALLKRSVLVLLLAGIGTARAADPQPYKVTIQAAGSGEMDAVLRSSSQLASLQDKVPVPPFALVQRAQSDVARFQTALDSFGYYLNGVTIKIAGHELSDPELPTFLDDAPANPPIAVDVAIEKGPLFHIGTIAFDGTVPPAVRDAARIKSGDPAIANAVLDAQAQLLAALQEDGYALATVEAPIAFADNEQHLVNLTYRVITGPRVEIGRIVFSGLKDVHEDFVRKVLTVKPGDRYRPSRIEEARQAVAGLGVFSGVTVHAATKLDADGRIALTFDVQERPQHLVTLNGSYSTDLGISLGATWSHRNLFGNAEQLNLSAAGTGLGTSTSGLGYNLGAQFIKPQFWRPDQVLEFDILGVRQQLDAYDQTAETAAVYLRRKFSPLWSGSVGAMLQYDQVAQENTNRLYQLIALPLTINYNSTGLSDLLRDPVSGARASVAVTPTQSFGANNLTFLVLQASGSAYFDLGEPGRSVLALRALAGSIMGGSNLELPPDQRLYAGGSATVRGFAYQSIGPQFPDNKPVGAKSVDAATIEFRQRILEDYGVAAFVDAGQASAGGTPFSGAVRVGAGIGARYYTPLGAVRADIAVPLNRIRGGDAFELYIGLGQAF
ncbi:MAG: BamA/TamA family outer membrane protein [Pseudomonadota bacterium]